jgi:hypothetical protein
MEGIAMSEATSADALSRPQRLGLWLLLAAVVVFGVVTEWRAAFMNTRKGDQEIYFRTAYAVRSGANLYDVEDTHNWHYVYPPFFAILIAPLAERPPDQPDVGGTMPFAWSVALWYAISVALLALGVHSLARAVEETTGGNVPRGGRRWWTMRLVPVLVCLPPVAHTLMRGQVNLLVLALLAGMAAATLRDRPWRAGLFLAAAIAIKIIPAFLLLFPAWRRDTRCLAGCGLGLVLFLVVVPLAVLGPEATEANYRAFIGRMILPGLQLNDDASRARELLAMDVTHSQSFLGAMHGSLYLGHRPPEADPSVRKLHWLFVALFTGATLAAVGWRTARSPGQTLLFFGCLMLLMILSSPVCHTHYFVMAIPLVLGVLAARRAANLPWLSPGWVVVLGLFFVTHLVMQLPALDRVRDMGVGLWPALLLLLGALRILWQSQRRAAATLAPPTDAVGPPLAA